MKQIRFLRLFLAHFFSRYSRRHYFSGIKPKYLFFLPLAAVALLVLVRLSSDLRLETEVSEGVIGVYTKNNLPPVVANLISRPLVSFNKNNRPEPELASGWQVNNDATLYTFKLRDNLYWSDGSKVRASDIKFNLTDVEVSYLDESTIQFKLADSFDPFPSLLTNPVFKGDTLVGLGQYKVLGSDLNRNIITKLVLGARDGSLPGLTVRFYPDERTARTAFELGEVQSLVGTSESEDIGRQPLVESWGVTNFNKIVAIFYNTKDPVLSDKNMRKALTAASPQISGHEWAKTSISPNSWVFNGEVKDLLGDRDLAKTYLGKVSSGGDSTVTLTTTPALASVGEKVISSWKEAGISAVLRVESGIPQNFQALLLAEPIPADPDQYALWHSTQSKTNISKYSSPRADKDLEDGRKTGDAEKRKEKYQDLQKVLLDDSPATFLYFPKTQVVYRKKIESDLKKILPLQFPAAR